MIKISSPNVGKILNSVFFKNIGSTSLKVFIRKHVRQDQGVDVFKV